MGKKDEILVTGGKQGERDKKGRFVKGRSGNPKGRPKTDEDLKLALLPFVPVCIDALRDILTSELARPQDKLKAIELVFDRVYGKPPQSKPEEDQTDKTIRITISGGEDFAN